MYMLDYLLNEPSFQQQHDNAGDGIKAIAEKVFTNGTSTNDRIMHDGGAHVDVDEDEEEWMGISD